MARIVNIKKSDGTVGNIPEQLGKLKAKINSTTSTDVTKLYAKTSDGSAQLVWDTTTASSTNISTNGPSGPCTNQPVCPNPNYSENLLYYPLIPGTTQRWGCQEWAECGNIVGLQVDTTTSSNSIFIDPDDSVTSYATVYNFIGSSPVPPPPGYITVDFTSFTIADRVAVFLKNNIQATANTFYRLTSSPENNILFAPRNVAFDNSHGNQTEVIYSLAGCNCSPDYTTCNPWNLNYTTADPAGDMPLCVLIPPSGSNSFCTCGGSGCGDGCFCDGSVIPSSSGGTQTCANLADLKTDFDAAGIGTTFIADTTCTATSDGCTTVCYGIPKPSTPSDQSPSYNDYSCRYVGKVPNIVAPSQISNNLWATGMTAEYFYNFGHSFNDFTILNESGCLGDAQSAWKIRIFLPFYVNLPDARWPSGTGATSGALTDSSSNLSLKGKYIKITKQNLNTDLVNVYNGYPILKAIQNLFLGNIKACSAVVSFPWNNDTAQTDTQITLWNLIEYPRQISAGVSSHTHQVVIEYSNPFNTCSLCINTSNNQQFNSSSVIGLYPITDTSGNIITTNQYNKFFTALNSSSTTQESLAAQRAIYSLRRQYHPVHNNVNSGGLYYWNNATVFTSSEQGKNSCLYREIYTGTTQTTTFNWNGQVVTTPTNQIGLKNILDRIQQLPITVDPKVPLTACDCNKL